MEIYLEISGGFAGLIRRGVLTGKDLPGELAERVCRAVEDGSLAACEKASSNPNLADGHTYRLTIKGRTGDERPRRFAFDESQISDDLLDLLDELTALLRRQPNG